MSWNYRLVRHRDAAGEFLAIHEVYYAEGGKPTSLTVDAVSVVGEDPDGIQAVLERMRGACDKPVLEYSAFVENAARPPVTVFPIRSDADHKDALNEIDRLMSAKPGSAEGDRLEVVATLVEAYERDRHPIPALVYVAYVRKEIGTDYGVEFPDLPGCVSAGVTLEEALSMGAEALGGHLSLLACDDAPIPEPSPVEALAAEALRTGALMVLIQAHIAVRI